MFDFFHVDSDGGKLAFFHAGWAALSDGNVAVLFHAGSVLFFQAGGFTEGASDIRLSFVEAEFPDPFPNGIAANRS